MYIPAEVSPSKQTREALETAWTERLEAARARYLIAKAECERVTSEYMDAAAVDGQFAKRKALEIERAAMHEYRRVLRIFTDLVVNGMKPPEE